MKWKPFTSGAPYTCQDCPTYAELKERAETMYRIANGFYHFFPSAQSLEQIGWDEDIKQEFAEHMKCYWEAIEGWKAVRGE